MDSYQVLASYYDRFTDDVGYEAWADYFIEIFRREQIQPAFIVDLACGTGTITELMARRGYEMMGVDASEEMLSQATMRTIDLTPRPMFIQQRLEKLDLYGTSDAFLCCLDSINYITNPQALAETFRRVYHFLEPDGIFIFDINTPYKFHRIAGQSYVREDEDVYCVWQCLLNGDLCTYEFDIFENDGKNRWKRTQETHKERIYEPQTLQDMLQKAGFCEIHCYGELQFTAPTADADRVFITARKRMENGNEQ